MLADSIAIIQSLDAEEVAQRLEELAAEDHALLVLPRSARARQQAQRCRQKRDGEMTAANFLGHCAESKDEADEAGRVQGAEAALNAA